MQDRSTPVASRLRLVSTSVPNEGSVAPPRQELVPRWSLGAVDQSWTTGELRWANARADGSVKVGRPGVAVCSRTSRIHRTGRGKLDLSGEFFQPVRRV